MSRNQRGGTSQFGDPHNHYPHQYPHNQNHHPQLTQNHANQAPFNHQNHPSSYRTSNSYPQQFQQQQQQQQHYEFQDFQPRHLQYSQNNFQSKPYGHEHHVQQEFQQDHLKQPEYYRHQQRQQPLDDQDNDRVPQPYPPPPLPPPFLPQDPRQMYNGNGQQPDNAGPPKGQLKVAPQAPPPQDPRKAQKRLNSVNGQAQYNPNNVAPGKVGESDKPTKSKENKDKVAITIPNKNKAAIVNPNVHNPTDHDTIFYKTTREFTNVFRKKLYKGFAKREKIPIPLTDSSHGMDSVTEDGMMCLSYHLCGKRCDIVGCKMSRSHRTLSAAEKIRMLDYLLQIHNRIVEYQGRNPKYAPKSTGKLDETKIAIAKETFSSIAEVNAMQPQLSDAIAVVGKATRAESIAVQEVQESVKTGKRKAAAISTESDAPVARDSAELDNQQSNKGKRQRSCTEDSEESTADGRFDDCDDEAVQLTCSYSDKEREEIYNSALREFAKAFTAKQYNKFGRKFNFSIPRMDSHFGSETSTEGVLCLNHHLGKCHPDCKKRKSHRKLSAPEQTMLLDFLSRIHGGIVELQCTDPEKAPKSTFKLDQTKIDTALKAFSSIGCDWIGIQREKLSKAMNTAGRVTRSKSKAMQESQELIERLKGKAEATSKEGTCPRVRADVESEIEQCKESKRRRSNEEHRSNASATIDDGKFDDCPDDESVQMVDGTASHPIELSDEVSRTSISEEDLYGEVVHEVARPAGSNAINVELTAKATSSEPTRQGALTSNTDVSDQPVADSTVVDQSTTLSEQIRKDAFSANPRLKKLKRLKAQLELAKKQHELAKLKEGLRKKDEEFQRQSRSQDATGSKVLAPISGLSASLIIGNIAESGPDHMVYYPNPGLDHDSRLAEYKVLLQGDEEEGNEDAADAISAKKMQIKRDLAILKQGLESCFPSTGAALMSREDLQRKLGEAQANKDLSYWRLFVSKQEHILSTVEKQIEDNSASLEQCVLDLETVERESREVARLSEALRIREATLAEMAAESSRKILRMRQRLRRGREQATM